jgi:hypothetical protein
MLQFPTAFNCLKSYGIKERLALLGISVQWVENLIDLDLGSLEFKLALRIKSVLQMPKCLSTDQDPVLCLHLDPDSDQALFIYNFLK